MIASLARRDDTRSYTTAWRFFDPVAYADCVVPIANRVGTGGQTTLDYCRDRGTIGYPLLPIADENPRKGASMIEATPLENLDRIRAVLNPAMSDLARALDVSRQSVYEWIGGGAISAENSKKLKDLSHVAELFDDFGLKGSNQLLRREIGGKSFYDRFRDGESAENIGEALASIARREAEQRDALNKRLNGRPPLTMSSEDFGTPHLSETD